MRFILEDRGLNFDKSRATSALTWVKNTKNLDRLKKKIILSFDSIQDFIQKQSRKNLEITYDNVAQHFNRTCSSISSFLHKYDKDHAIRS